MLDLNEAYELALEAEEIYSKIDDPVSIAETRFHKFQCIDLYQTLLSQQFEDPSAREMFTEDFRKTLPQMFVPANADDIADLLHQFVECQNCVLVRALCELVLKNLTSSQLPQSLKDDKFQRFRGALDNLKAERTELSCADIRDYLAVISDLLDRRARGQYQFRAEIRHLSAFLTLATGSEDAEEEALSLRKTAIAEGQFAAMSVKEKHEELQRASKLSDFEARGEETFENEQALGIFTKYLSDPFIRDNTEFYQWVLTKASSAFQNRTFGNPSDNRLKALTLLERGASLPVDECHTELWCENKIKYAEELNSARREGIVTESSHVPLQHLDDVIALLKVKKKNSVFVLRALISRIDLEIENGAKDIRLGTDEIRDLLNHFNPQRSGALARIYNLYGGKNFLIYNEFGGDERLVSAGNAFQKASELFSEFGDQENAVGSQCQQAMMLQLRGKWAQAEAILKRVFEERDANFRDPMRVKDLIIASSTSLNHAAFSAAACDDLKAALWRHEVLTARELLLAIINAPTMGSDMDTGEYKQFFQRVMIGDADGAALLALIKSIPSDKSHDAIFDDFDAFNQKLDGFLKANESWLLIPFFSLNHVRFALIPPKSSLDDAILSPILNIGVRELLSAGDRTGHYVDRVFGKKLAFYELSEVLWPVSNLLREMFGDWVSEQISAHKEPEIIVISHRFLNIFPMSLATLEGQAHVRPANVFSSVPSLSILMHLSDRERDRPDRPKRLSLIASEEEDLPSLGLEEQLLDACIPRSSSDGIDATHIHFMGHGAFDVRNPGDSYFKMSQSKQLFLEDAELTPRDPNLRLVTFGACQLGAINVLDHFNESIGFQTRFLVIGASGVLAALWAVSDEATCLLMAKFYELHIQDDITPARALFLSQRWLSAATDADIRDFVIQKTSKAAMSKLTKAELFAKLDELNEERPFSDPVFWAGFTYVGI